MKLLTISSLYYPYVIGGAENSTRMIAEGMINFGFSSVVITIAPEEKIEEVNGVKVYYVTKRNLYHFFPKRAQRPGPIRLLWHLIDLYNPWMGRVVGRILEAEKPDLVHTSNLAGFSGAVWTTAKRRGLPLVHTIRDHYLLCPNSVMYKGMRNCSKPCPSCLPFHYVRRRLTAQVDYAVAVSAFVMARHRQFGFFDRAQQAIIHNAAALHPSPDRPQANKPINFGYIGRLEAAKGVEVLLKGFSGLAADEATLTLAGAGDAAYVRNLREGFASPQVEFLGFVPAEDFYRRVDVLIVPSLLHDSDPRVIKEAMTHSIPVIGARRGGIPEILEEGKTGFLFEPSRPAELQKQIQKFLDQPALVTRMGQQCLKRARDFTPEVMCRQYLEIYRSLIEKLEPQTNIYEKIEAQILSGGDAQVSI
jgi:glycosyltransferase involved in cell wall biosynthesis